jgi:hypothetical protein
MEDRALLEFEGTRLGPIDFSAGQVCRQQVRRELDAVEVAGNARREFLDRSGLGEAGCALDQKMSVSEQRSTSVDWPRMRVPSSSRRARNLAWSSWGWVMGIWASMALKVSGIGE